MGNAHVLVMAKRRVAEVRVFESLGFEQGIGTHD
jgi:hypothetical protein